MYDLMEDELPDLDLVDASHSYIGGTPLEYSCNLQTTSPPKMTLVDLNDNDWMNEDQNEGILWSLYGFDSMTTYPVEWQQLNLMVWQAQREQLLLGFTPSTTNSPEVVEVAPPTPGSVPGTSESPFPHPTTPKRTQAANETTPSAKKIGDHSNPLSLM